MNSFLAELGNNSIITADAVERLKRYIARKSPDASVPKRALILADALNKAIDSRLPGFEEMRCKKLKRLMLEHVTKKPAFEIFCSDVFQAAVEMKESGEDFIDDLEVWLSTNLGRQLPREQLVDVVLESHELMMLRPEMDMADTIAAAEAAVAASFAGQTEPASSALTEETTVTDAMTVGQEEAQHMVVASSASYAAVRLKAIARKSSTRVEAAVPVSSASYAAVRLKTIVRKTSVREETAEPVTAAGLDIAEAGNEASGPYAVLGYFSEVFTRKSITPAFSRYMNEWRRLSAAAAAVVLITAGLVFGIGRMADRTANGAEYLADAVNRSDNPYELTVLAEEDIAAGANGAESGSTLKMKATAYDLSVESCGKLPGEPGYGITSSGAKAQVGRTVAVDPEVIPLGSRLMISFPDEYSHLDGVYIAEDTGRMIKGSSIDIFFGEDMKDSKDIYGKAMEFGVRYVDVKILDDPERDAS